MFSDFAPVRKQADSSYSFLSKTFSNYHLQLETDSLSTTCNAAPTRTHTMPPCLCGAYNSIMASNFVPNCRFILHRARKRCAPVSLREFCVEMNIYCCYCLSLQQLTPSAIQTFVVAANEAHNCYLFLTTIRSPQNTLRLLVLSFSAPVPIYIASKR